MSWRYGLGTMTFTAARATLKGRTITDHALDLVRRGRTTVGEVVRVANQMEL